MTQQLEQIFGEPASPELSDLVRVGQAVRFFWGDGNPNNHTAHIRAIVDDEFVVYRTWARHKQRWIYRVDHACWFQINHEGGILSKA